MKLQKKTVLEEVIISISNQIIKNTSISTYHDYSLGSGLLGQSLFLAHAAIYFKNENYSDIAIEMLERAIELNNSDTKECLFIGYIGTSWLIRHFINIGLLDENTKEELKSTDILIQNTIQDKENEILIKSDLMYGVVGVGVYFIEKYLNGDKSALTSLEKIVDTITALSHQTAKGICFPDPFFFKRGEVVNNLGLAHGIPGTISFLSRVYQLGIRKNKIKNIIEGVATWLFNYELPSTNLSLYASLVSEKKNEKIKGRESRLAWCYGDLGIAKSLLDAETIFNDGFLKENALRIIDHTLNRDVEAAKIAKDNEFTDVTFCHGTISLFHLYHRMFQSTQIEKIGERANYWLEKVLHTKEKMGKIKGYRSVDYGNSDELIWFDDSGLLNGAAGVGLPLLSLLDKTNNKHSWDNIMLTNNSCHDFTAKK